MTAWTNDNVYVSRDPSIWRVRVEVKDSRSNEREYRVSSDRTFRH